MPDRSILPQYSLSSRLSLSAVISYKRLFLSFR
jgi:hypothetical protein